MARWILIAAGLLVVLLGCGIGFRVQDDVVNPGPDGARRAHRGRCPAARRLHCDQFRECGHQLGDGACDAAGPFRLTARRRRRARWDAEWRETAPRWTRGEG